MGTGAGMSVGSGVSDGGGVDVGAGVSVGIGGGGAGVVQEERRIRKRRVERRIRDVLCCDMGRF